MISFDSYKADFTNAFVSRFYAEAYKAAQKQNDLETVTNDNAKAILARNNASMFSTLSALEKGMLHDTVCKFMHTHKVPATIVMRSERSDSHMNVYALEKVLRTARTLLSAATLERYTVSALLTARNLTQANLEMSHQDLIDCIMKNKSARAEYLHYFEHAKGKGTADTQASSSINALQCFEVLIETRNAANRAAYKLNTEHKNTKKLLALFA